MNLQHTKYVPKELLVQFDGVQSLVRPVVEYNGERAVEIPKLARQDGLHQLYTDNIIADKSPAFSRETR